MGLKGKGFFIWKIRDVEGGDPEAIASTAQSAGYSHVLLKIADGSYPYNVDRHTNVDLTEPVVHALRQRGLAVWGWHYVYGNGPVGEANIAIRRLEQLNLDGYVVDAEAEYKEPGKANAAKTYMDRLRRRFPDLPIALSSFRFPAYHPQFPWKAFLEKCDLNMPQVYWEKAHNPAAQLRRTVREFQTMVPARPVIPTGPAYTVGGWTPTNQDTTEFLNTCLELNLPAANFFSWDECRARLPELWDHICAFRWPDSTVTEDITNQYIAALNSGDPNQVMALYVPFAIHITPARTTQGADGIKAWFSALLKETLPNAAFQMTGVSGMGSSRYFTWTAQSGNGRVLNGSDTIGLLDGKIAYHYSYYTVSN